MFLTGFACAALLSIVIKRSPSREVKRYDVDSRFSDAIRYGELVFISGQVGSGETIEEQMKTALASVDAALAKANTDKTMILEVTIWLADMADYDEMNKVYDAWLPPKQPACRACIQAKLASPDYRVEVRVIAGTKF
jgi:enamine deaminase RidA (YjgF/YER057c/UK114 family)